MRIAAMIAIVLSSAACASHQAPTRTASETYWVRVGIVPLEKRDQYRCDVEILDSYSGKTVAEPKVATKWGKVAQATVTGGTADSEVTVTFDKVNERVVCTASVRDRGRVIAAATATAPRG